MMLSDFDYDLPQGLIAQYPAESRESSRMLVLDRTSGKITHACFRGIGAYLDPGDIIVLNDTKVINARLFGTRATGGKVELFLIGSAGEGRFKVLIRPSKRIKEGEEISFGAPELKARLITKKPAGSIIELLPPSVDIEKVIKEAGTVPLPPYIKRDPEPIDKERYQTVYAKVAGATAAPTAGLHFTDEILGAIASKGTKITRATLHVNYGTFAPVKSENIVDHKMHTESFKLSRHAATEINGVKAGGGRVLAVGTTSCRALETCAVDGGRVKEREDDTGLFIYPSYKFKVVDMLLTNFHLPKSTLLMLVSAFAGRESILKAYKEAIKKRYRFFSYGDCMLIA